MLMQAALVATVVLAGVSDLRSQRVPNVLTLCATIFALALHCFSGGLAGLLFGVGGLATGLALLIGFYMAGGMGAGDVKLLATVGAFVGPAQVLWVFFFAAIAGGLYALGLLLVVAVSRPGGINAARGLRSGIMTLVLTGGDVRSLSSSLESYPKLRYAVVIGLGVVAARLLDGTLS